MFQLASEVWNLRRLRSSSAPREDAAKGKRERSNSGDCERGDSDDAAIFPAEFGAGLLSRFVPRFEILYFGMFLSGAGAGYPSAHGQRTDE